MDGGVERCRASIPLVLNSSSPATFSKILRQRASVALALRHERHPVVVGFVFEPDLEMVWEQLDTVISQQGSP